MPGSQNGEDCQRFRGKVSAAIDQSMSEISKSNPFLFVQQLPLDEGLWTGLRQDVGPWGQEVNASKLTARSLRAKKFFLRNSEAVFNFTFEVGQQTFISCI
jgi:hypothetical protein